MSDAEIRWDLQCMTPTGNVGNWFVDTPIHRGNFAQRQDFTVGSDCRAQLLVLRAAGGGNQLGAEFTLRSVDVTPK